MGAVAYQMELINKAVAGNVAALSALLANAHAGLRGRLSHRLPSDLRGVVDVDDVLQEAHVQAYLHIRGFTPHEADSFDRWLATIALRRLHNAVRKQRTLKRGGGMSAMPTDIVVQEGSVVALLDLMTAPGKTPSRSAASHEAAQAVREAMAQLPSDYQKAVGLAYLEGCSAAEAAERMGRTERAVHNLCYKARIHLRRLLGSRSRFLSRSG